MKKNLLSLLLITFFVIAGCAPAPAEPTPIPVDVGLLQTQAVQTVIAQVTQTALAVSPTSEPLPSETPTPENTTVPTLDPNITPSPIICDNSAFVADVSIKDGETVTAGQEFQKTWRIKNTGSCTWTTGYYLQFAYGEQMNGVVTYLTQEVLPNQEVEITVLMRAPATAGNYSGYWRMVNNNRYGFGEIFTIVITVP